MSVIVSNGAKQSMVNGSAYIPKGQSPLSPYEVLDLASALLNSNDLSKFQFYVMTLIGIKLFLRSDELLSLRIESFNKSLSLVSLNQDVLSLALTVQGKAAVFLVIQRQV